MTVLDEIGYRIAIGPRWRYGLVNGLIVGVIFLGLQAVDGLERSDLVSAGCFTVAFGLVTALGGAQRQSFERYIPVIDLPDAERRAVLAATRPRGPIPTDPGVAAIASAMVDRRLQAAGRSKTATIVLPICLLIVGVIGVYTRWPVLIAIGVLGVFPLVWAWRTTPLLERRLVLLREVAGTPQPDPTYTG